MKKGGNMWEHVDFFAKCFKIEGNMSVTCGNMWGNMLYSS